MLLGVGRPSNAAARVAPPREMLPIGSGKGSHLFGLGDCLGVCIGGTVAGGCSSVEDILGG